jgi:hypothetical protein
LFDRLCAKFRYRQELWKEYLKFCIQAASRKNFYRVFSNAVRYNSSSLLLWKIAIYFEFDFNLNPFKGRQLFVKALKMNSSVKAFWIEYLRFEAKFVKLLELRQDSLLKDLGEAKENSKEKEEAFGEDDEGFLAFDEPGDENNNQGFRNLMESSDEETDPQVKVDLEKKKSNHTLLLVIIQSMKENFAEGIDVETYRTIFRVLREEGKGSQEIKLARDKLLEEAVSDDNVTEEDKMVLRFEAKGIYEPVDSEDLSSVEKIVRKASRALVESDNKSLAIEAICKCSPNTVAVLNKDEEFIRVFSNLLNNHKEIGIKELIKAVDLFDVEIPEKAKKRIEESKYEMGVLKLYLNKILRKSSTYEKVKYLEEFAKRLGTSKPGESISAIKKLEISKQMIDSVIEYVKQRDFDTEDPEGKYKYIAQYLKVLISMTKLNIELIGHLGFNLIKQWIEPQKSDRLLVDTFGDAFWPLKKQCPATVYAFLLQNSTKYNKPSHYEVAIQCYEHSLDLWKLRLELAKLNNDLQDLDTLYQRGLSCFKDAESKNAFMATYQKVMQE